MDDRIIIKSPDQLTKILNDEKSTSIIKSTLIMWLHKSLVDRKAHHLIFLGYKKIQIVPRGFNIFYISTPRSPSN